MGSRNSYSHDFSTRLYSYAMNIWITQRRLNASMTEI